MYQKGYKSLIVWQKGFQLAIEIYLLTKQFPVDERFNLVSQMRRSVVSVISNLAEGFTRKSTGEYINFTSYSRGSCAELETQLLLSFELKYISKSNFEKLHSLWEEIAKMLYVLEQKLEQKKKALSPKPYALRPISNTSPD